MTENTETALDLLATADAETVTTGQLGDGDILRLNGCLMQLGPIKERADDVNRGAYGLVRWSAATVLRKLDSTIPNGWFDRNADGHRTWQVQGNELATWQRVLKAA